jgi:hypothetical protein
MIEGIKKAVHKSARGNQKMAMFHFQVLKNAPESPEEFCRDVSVPTSYKAEFRKMLSLARVMRQQGVRLV